MDFIEIKKNNGIAILTINRGKVNALNDEIVKHALRQNKCNHEEVKK